jgi:hypothetical protein
MLLLPKVDLRDALDRKQLKTRKIKKLEAVKTEENGETLEKWWKTGRVWCPIG